MTDKEELFLDDTLTADQLQEFRKEVDATTDTVLEERMWQRWNNEETDNRRTDHNRLAAIWVQIKNNIQTEQAFSWHKVWRCIQIAAVIMLPILLCSTFYLYRENIAFTTDKTTISTTDNERATIILPDGSKVTLNEKTTLAYNSKSFNRSKRQIEFEGEGFFEVAKDTEHPFTIDADELEVRVLGTKFNLNACKKNLISELTLEEGSVLFTAMQTGKSATLAPHQKAMLDKSTGSITVTEVENAVNDATAWKRKELVFRNIPLHQVLKSIEKHYGIVCNVCPHLNINDRFTGTIPGNNINDVLQILETSYHCRATLKDNQLNLLAP